MKSQKVLLLSVSAILLGFILYPVLSGNDFFQSVKANTVDGSEEDQVLVKAPKLKEPVKTKAPEPKPPAPLNSFGKFLVGSEAALDESGFTGNPLVNVMIAPEDNDYNQLVETLSSPEVSGFMRGFTGCLLDRRIAKEFQLEQKFEKQGVQIVVRSMNGKYLGGLRYGFKKIDLLRLLERIKKNNPFMARRSSKFSSILNNPNVLDQIRAVDGVDKAHELVNKIEEELGSEDPRIQALKDKLNQ